MPLSKQLLQKLSSGTYNLKYLDLSSLNLTDAEFLPIIESLVLNKSIKSINLRNNQLTNSSWLELAKNTTLTEIVLTGNTAIKPLDLKPFETNRTLTRIIGARGKVLQEWLKKKNKPRLIADKKKAQHLNNAIIKEDQQNLVSIASGEASFQQLIHSFIFDLADFNSNKDFIIWYAAVSLNCYMHNASHAPLAEFSSVQDRESKAKLYYSRSQDLHPIARRNDAFIKDVVAKKQEITKITMRKRGVGVLNKPVVKLFNSSIGDNNPAKTNKRTNLITNLNNINPEHGFPKKGKSIKDYFSLALAHGGLRSNNIVATKTILEAALIDVDNPSSKMSKLLKSHSSAKTLTNTTRKIKKLLPEQLSTRIKAYHAKFKQLSLEKADVLSNLQAKVLQFKKSRGEDLCQQFINWSVNKENPLELQVYGAGCLVINIKPQLLKISNKASETKKQQITEVLIGFLAGIINHQISINNSSLWVERRQSFGFNLSTLTDVGSLKIRLSHGLEPKIFNNILLDSFKLFYDAIKQEKVFQPKLIKTRSEDLQWRAAFEAQYYLQSEKENKPDVYVKQAFNNYIEYFAIKNIYKVIDPYNADFIKGPKVTNNNGDVFNQSPIFAILQNSLSYAIELACCLDVEQTNISLQFKQSYLHSQGKLYIHCTDAKKLLTKINSNNIEASKAFQQANILLENIIEYSLLLDNLHAIQAKQLGAYIDPTIKLCKTESKYVSKSFKVKDEAIDIYFTDSGQQAIVTTLLALDLELLLSQEQENRVDACFYNFGNSYFEVTSFIDDIGWQLTTKANATLTFVDLTNLKEFSFNNFENLKSLVIDVTHQPLFTDELKLIVNQAEQNNVITVFVSSCLKHDELGLDKYTAGKITIIKPKDFYLHDEVNALFKSISEDGNTHAVRSYLQMVNDISGDKTIKIPNKSNSPFSGSFFTPKTKDEAKEQQPNHIPKP